MWHLQSVYDTRIEIILFLRCRFPRPFDLLPFQEVYPIEWSSFFLPLRDGNLRPSTFLGFRKPKLQREYRLGKGATSVVMKKDNKYLTRRAAYVSPHPTRDLCPITKTPSISDGVGSEQLSYRKKVSRALIRGGTERSGKRYLPWPEPRFQPEKVSEPESREPFPRQNRHPESGTLRR